MSSLKAPQQKWIVLSALILFCLSGGIYKIAKRRGPTTPDGAVSATVTADSKTPGGSVPPGAPLAALAPNSPTAQTSTDTPSITTATATAPIVPAPASDQCVTMTFKHKVLADHADEESCSHHKNVLKLSGENINSKSVCVRVNGTPVHYLAVKGRPNEVIFGSVAGPKSNVSVRFCTGKGPECAKFAEDCTVPKDEFMEAIGGSKDETGSARLGQWDPAHPSEKEADVLAKLDGTVLKELETNDDLNGRAPAGDDMFKDWYGETQAAPCGTKQANN